MKKPENMSKWDGRAKGSYLGNWIFMRIITLAGPFPAYLLLIFVSFYYSLFNFRVKKILKEFHGVIGLSSNWCRIYKHFFSFGMNLIDRLAFLCMKKSPFRLISEGDEYILKALERKKGLIIISAHAGNWEIGGEMFLHHFGIKPNVIVFDNEKEEIKELFKNASKNRTANVIPVNQNRIDMMLNVRNSLKNNEIVCFLGDRIIGNEDNKKIRFFGREASFPVGPFAIAAISGAPIITVFSIKVGLRKYLVKAYPPIFIKNKGHKTRDEQISDVLKGYVSILEDLVSKHPYQWYNYYHFWD